jgi:phage terminase large subunit-like protein
MSFATADFLNTEIDLATVEQALRHRQTHRIEGLFPDSGPLRRELYVKHLEFFRAGAEYRERAFIAGNRTGKSESGAYETTLHLTGLYPHWWEGHRFSQPIRAWAAGDTNQTVRDILQAKFCGHITRAKGDNPSQPLGLGTGMIPGDAIRATRPKSHLPNAIDTVWIRHASGGTSTLSFKSYEQGRESFQGTEQDLILLDEEPQENVYYECLMRIMRTGAFKGGILLATFTPLRGWSTVVNKYLNEKERIEGHRFAIQAGWDDAPHLTEEEKQEMARKLPPHQRDARMRGVPQLGAGAIWPVPESEITCDPFEIPKHWPRCYALDVGWNATAALWIAWDRENDVAYAYAEHKYAHSEPSDNARAIRAKGAWIPGVIDPASRGRSQKDGEQLIQVYKDLGLDVTAAVNAVEAGLQAVWEHLVSGRLKIFKSCARFLEEFRLYRRDEKGHVVKQNDHLCDCCRYVTVAYRSRATTEPVKREPEQRFITTGRMGPGSNSWMAG